MSEKKEESMSIVMERKLNKVTTDGMTSTIPNNVSMITNL